MSAGQSLGKQGGKAIRTLSVLKGRELKQLLRELVDLLVGEVELRQDPKWRCFFVGAGVIYADGMTGGAVFLHQSLAMGHGLYPCNPFGQIIGLFLGDSEIGHIAVFGAGFFQQHRRDGINRTVIGHKPEGRRFWVGAFAFYGNSMAFCAIGLG